MKAYACDICGNVVEVIRDSAIIPICCGTNMRLVVPNSNDAATLEKHVPEVKKDGNKVTVNIGEIIHPSTPDHYIEWIELETKSTVQRRYLKPYEIPSVTFLLTDEDDEIVNVYAYCNIHGLWSRY